MFKIIFPVLMALLTTFTMVEEAKACSCGPSGSVDGAYENSQNVVVLKLRSVEKYPDASGEDRFSVGNVKRSVLTVEKIFKGQLKVGQELPFRQGGGGDCVWTFSEASIGNEYLLYLDPKPGKDGLWTGHACSRSGSTKYRASDLLYLEKLSKVVGKSRLSGRISQEITSAVEGGYQEDKLLGERIVRITGNGKNIKLKTNSDGVYEIYDLPAGKYKITPEKVAGYKISSYSDEQQDFIEADLEDKSHEEVDFEFEIDNSIHGKIVDAKGLAVPSVCLDLEPVQGKLAPYTYLGTCTKEGGNFKFDEIPAGSYVIVVNKDGKINGDHPFGRFFYPDKSEREAAAEISIGPGEHLTGLILTAPDTLETVVYTGKILFSDGRPVAKESVQFYKNSDKLRVNDYYPDTRTQTDANGEFTLKLLKGIKGYIFGSFMTYSGEYEKCPKLEKMIRDSGSKSIVTFKTTELQVDPLTDLSGIELTLPFPSCKRADNE